MADFVDNFFGNSFDDPKSQAVMALASGLMGGDWRKGVNGYLGAMGTAGEYNSKKQLQQMQMQEMLVKNAAKKQEMEQEAQKYKIAMAMLGYGGQSQENQTTPTQGLLGEQPSTPKEGLLRDAPQGGRTPLGGVDKSAAAMNLLFNGGKDIGNWVHDTTKPNWVNMNGYLINTNAPNFRGGAQPGVKVSESGMATQWQPDENGKIVFGAPKGAPETYGLYRNIDEAAKSGNKSIKVYNPETGREEYVSESTVLNAAKQPSAPRQMPQTAPSGAYNGYAGNSRANADAGAIEVLQSEINNPKTTPENKAAAMRELQRIRPTQGAQSGAFAAAPSAFEAAKAKAQETAMVEQAKADVTPTKAKQAVIESSQNALSLIDKALTHPGLNTAVGLSGKIDPRNYIPGTDATDFQVLHKQLTGNAFLLAYERLKGGGAISEIESTKGEAAIARINTAQSEKELRAGLKDLGDIYRSVLSREKGSQQPTASKVIDALPTANNGNKGQRIRDTSTGKILKSNGISWVAE